jgi:hypothetical protein
MSLVKPVGSAYTTAKSIVTCGFKSNKHLKVFKRRCHHTICHDGNIFHDLWVHVAELHQVRLYEKETRWYTS